MLSVRVLEVLTALLDVKCNLLAGMSFLLEVFFQEVVLDIHY